MGKQLKQASYDERVLLDNKLTANELTAKKVLGYRNEIYGIAALWIILFHVADYTTPMYLEGENMSTLVGFINKIFTILRTIFLKGNTGVDIFLFLSAIGLYQSYHNNNLSTFYKRRFNRVVIPYLLVAVTYFLLSDFIYFKSGLKQSLLNISTIELWLSGHHPWWYASFIVIMYAFYPILYKWDDKTKHKSTICIILLWIAFTAFMWYNKWGLYVNVERAVSRVPIFLFGIIVAPHIFEEGSFSIKKSLFWLSCTIVSIGVVVISLFYMPSFIRRYIMGTIGIGIIIWSTLRNRGYCQCLSRPLLFVGAMTFETYLIHVVIKEIIDINEWWDIFPSWVWYIIVILMTLPIAWCLVKVTEFIKMKFKLN